MKRELKLCGTRSCRDRMVVGFTTTFNLESVPITTNVVSLNPA
jgi:hypothetical protein